MKSKKNQPPAAEEPAARLEKGVRVSPPGVGAGGKRGTIASQTKTTRRLDRTVKRDADDRMAGKQKAIARWEGEGGALPPAKKGGKQ